MPVVYGLHRPHGWRTTVGYKLQPGSEGKVFGEIMQAGLQ